MGIFGKSSSQQYNEHKQNYLDLLAKFKNIEKENILVDNLLKETPPVIKAKIFIKDEMTKRELEIISLPKRIVFTVMTSGHGKYFVGTSKKHEISFTYNLLQ